MMHSPEAEGEDRLGGSNPLLRATAAAHVEMVQLLLAADADVDVGNADGVSVMVTAAKAGSVEIVRLLGEGDADPDRTDEAGRTPLHIAVEAAD